MDTGIAEEEADGISENDVLRHLVHLRGRHLAAVGVSQLVIRHGPSDPVAGQVDRSHSEGAGLQRRRSAAMLGETAAKLLKSSPEKLAYGGDRQRGCRGRRRERRDRRVGASVSIAA
jgi:hypothetical protein